MTTPSAHIAHRRGSTEQALRTAMDRLFSGRPQHTDGRLIKNNLYKEAGVSRATMNRATNVLAEWDARVAAAAGPSTAHCQHEDAIRGLRADLAKAKERARRLQQQLDAAATVIGALHAENTVLRERQSLHSAAAVPIARAKADV